MDEWQPIVKVVLLHTATYLPARSWSDSGSSRLAHGSACGLLVLWAMMLEPVRGIWLHSHELTPAELLAERLGWVLAALVVLALGLWAAGRPPAEGEHRRPVLGNGTPACAVGLLFALALHPILSHVDRLQGGPLSSAFLGGLFPALVAGGCTLGLTCAYAGMIEVRRRNRAPGWGAPSLVFFVLAVLYSMSALTEAL